MLDGSLHTIVERGAAAAAAAAAAENSNNVVGVVMDYL
jgi:hypothetical protein